MDVKEAVFFIGVAATGALIGTVLGNLLSKKLHQPLKCNCANCAG